MTPIRNYQLPAHMVPISAKNLHKFCFQMGTGLRAGLDTLTCWKQCARLLGRSFDSRAEQVTKSLQDGVFLNESLSEHGKIIPPLVIQMIQLGELTGKTEIVFLDLAEYYQADFYKRDCMACIRTGNRSVCCRTVNRGLRDARSKKPDNWRANFDSRAFRLEWIENIRLNHIRAISNSRCRDSSDSPSAYFT